MSMHQLLNGTNPATFFILPMLGRHPDTYPRFRDCYALNDEFGNAGIQVYTRVGGGNRQDYVEAIAELIDHPEYVKNEDDDFDSTYATFTFNVPEKWKAQFDALMKHGPSKEIITPEYLEQLIRVYPKLETQIRETYGL